MSDHKIVFNMRVQLPGAPQDTPGQIPYEAMMATFDRTRKEGVKEGWRKALTALREAVEAEASEGTIGQVDVLDRWIRVAADSKHCPDFS